MEIENPLNDHNSKDKRIDPDLNRETKELSGNHKKNTNEQTNTESKNKLNEKTRGPNNSSISRLDEIENSICYLNHKIEETLWHRDSLIEHKEASKSLQQNVGNIEGI